MNVRLSKTLLLVPVLLVSCTKDFTMREVTSTRISASSGGIARSHDGLVEIEFAPGALAEDADIRIEAQRDLMSTAIASRAVYDLGPDGLTFQGDVTLRFRVDPASEEMAIVNLDSGEPAELASSNHDLTSGLVSAKLEHFSLYALILRYRACRNKVCGDPCALCPPWRPTCVEPPGGPRVCGPQGLCIAAASPAAQCSASDAGTSAPDAGGGPRDGGSWSIPDAGDGSVRDGSVPGFLTEVEPNDTPQSAQTLPASLGSPVTVHGSIDPVGDHDYYYFIVPAGQTYEVQATTYDQPTPYGCVGADTVLTLYDASQTQLANDDDGGEGMCSQLTVTLSSGVYYLRVRAFPPVVIPSYRLEVLFRFVASVDGGVRDGSVPGPNDAGTSDGGTRDGGVTALMEIEPNDSIGQAVVAIAPVTFTGSIGAPGDVDVFGFVLPPGATQVVMTTYTQLGDPSVCISADTRIRMFNAGGMQLAVNDDYNGVGCSQIIAAVVDTESYFVQVEHFSTSGTIPTYYLDVTPQ